MAIRPLKRLRETAQRMADGGWDFEAVFNREIYPAINAIVGRLAEGGYSTVQEEGVALPKQTTLNFIGSGVTAEDDDANNRTDVTITTALSSLTNFDARNDPIFLYNFDLGFANLASTGADGDLIPDGASTIYETYISPGKSAVYIPVGNQLISTNYNATIGQNGDITLMAIMQLDQYTADLSFYITHGAVGETEPTNILYSLTGTEGFTPPRLFGWLSENGAGVNSAVNCDAAFALPPIHNLMWLGVRRSGTTVTTWINGIQRGSGTITTPTGGTGAACRLYIGGFPGFTSASHVMFGAKGVARAYTDDEMREEYNYTMGVVYGEL